MSYIHETQHNLARVQSRRKFAIWLFGICFMPAFFFTKPHFEVGSWQRQWIEDIGAVLIFAAILGRAWCIMYIGGRKTSTLVTAGPYSVMRNPLYFFSFIAAAGLGAQTGSVMLALFVALAAYMIFLPVVLREEAGLSRVHGPGYDAYRHSVPRFFPRPALWRDVVALAVDPGIWRRTVLDGIIFILLIPLVRVLARGQTTLLDLPRVTLY
ncbi:isoprenylcysteine carboxylmethyltransferase family protein [Chelativorans sp. M5D2P16]|uniref:methyltransferase family protein n=1 Tax=Chelativorans sp. M5D2P16 TaxID=3095678 RepID=UPI002ACA1F2C|nr:isoprenylcysteine carboxylmethyltransferase family protein [Chelativorans sp. M5D2P16]MDZ5699464.1 isoprenylcysteine carboxylmethyltransferase family protein [Chelativorans sp. M5D2P16]